MAYLLYFGNFDLRISISSSNSAEVFWSKFCFYFNKKKIVLKKYKNKE